ncbi:MAG: nicotinamide riboside transporter PnuC [Muribaculaceae bacterium]|nr:nicotinamide riboside transporter PnuC [Muribaculaceae bacterium]
MTFNPLEILGLAVGLLYLWWEYHANPRMWLASVVMPAISMWIYYSKGLYADFGINIYYLAIAVYGYIRWTRRSHRPESRTRKEADAKATPVTHITPAAAAGATGVFALIWAALWLFLEYCTDSTVAPYDAFTTALSIVAMWLLARKYAEQWLAWIAVDAVCVGLYIYKGIPFYAALYALYTLIAIFGYRKWLRLIPKD